MKHEYPTSSAQDQVLQALGLKAENYAQAQRLLEAFGLSVTPVRQGRKSIPSISLMDGSIGGWNPGYEDGWSDTIDYRAIDLTPILPWIIERDQNDAKKRIARAQAKAVTIDADALVAADNAAKQQESDVRRADEQRRKDARELRGRQNAMLRTNGYRWHNLGDDPDDEQGDGPDWVLYAPDGRPISVDAALHEIEAIHQKREAFLNATQTVTLPTIEVSVSVAFLERKVAAGHSLYFSPSNGLYWDSCMTYDDDVRLGNAGDFFRQNGIEFDANGDPAGDYPSQGKELKAVFRSPVAVA